MGIKLRHHACENKCSEKFQSRKPISCMMHEKKLHHCSSFHFAHSLSWFTFLVSLFVSYIVANDYITARPLSSYALDFRKDQSEFVFRGRYVPYLFSAFPNKKRSNSKYRLPLASLTSSSSSSSSFSSSNNPNKKKTKSMLFKEEGITKERKSKIDDKSSSTPIAISTWKFGRIAVREAAQILSNGGNALDAVEMGVTAVEMVCNF